MAQKDFKRNHKREKDEFDQHIIDLARVTRVMAGGKRMRFRACVIVGDRKGRLGMAVKKGADVTMAINKAVTSAKKSLFRVPIVNGTIPHETRSKYCGAEIILRPTAKGRGIIAGGALRPILELSGIHDVVGKILGSDGKINNVLATMEALKSLRDKSFFEELRKVQ